MKLSKWPKKKQSAKADHMHSTEIPHLETSVLYPQTKQPAIQSSTISRTCKEATINDFIQAYCNNDLSYLIKSGLPSDEEIQTAWNEILFEYSGLLKSPDSDYIFQLEKERSLLQWHITYVDSAIDLLRVRYEQDIVDELINLGYDLVNNESFHRQLDRVFSLAKSKINDLQMLDEEYERLTRTLSGKKQTEEEFESTVVWLSKFQSYHIDTFTTSIYRFTIIFNNYMAFKKANSK